jgi:hypothetical protein
VRLVVLVIRAARAQNALRLTRPRAVGGAGSLRTDRRVSSDRQHGCKERGQGVWASFHTETVSGGSLSAFYLSGVVRRTADSGEVMNRASQPLNAHHLRHDSLDPLHFRREQSKFSSPGRCAPVCELL